MTSIELAMKELVIGWLENFRPPFAKRTPAAQERRP